MIHDAFQNYEGESLVIFMPSREWKIDINNKLASMHFFFFVRSFWRTHTIKARKEISKERVGYWTQN